MKLIFLKLCNFRQFYGETPKIYFAQGEKNITVIYGNNGAGKTTLLNALTWVLYGKFTDAFASPELLVNKRAIAEANTDFSLSCWVELQFEHENKIYQIKRKCYGQKKPDGTINYSPAKLSMLVAGDDGAWYHPTQAYEDAIYSILPESLHRYFFFDGEHIDRIFRHNSNNNLAEDTKELLGVKVLDRAIKHLTESQKTLQNELKNTEDIQIKQLLQANEKLQNNKKVLQNRQKTINQALTYSEAEKQNITQEILALSGVEETKQLYLKLQVEAKTLRHNMQATKQAIKAIISSSSYLVFLPTIAQAYLNLINQLKTEGKLSDHTLNHQFIEKLLEQQKCICGTKLQPNTPPHAQISALLQQAKILQSNETIFTLETEAINLSEKIDKFYQQIDSKNNELQNYRLALAQTENQLDTIHQKLKQYPNQDIKLLQAKLENIEANIKEYILELGVNQQKISTLERQIKQSHQNIKKYKIKEEKLQLTQQRIVTGTEVISRLTEVRKRLEKKFRLSLEQKVQEIFSSISFTPYIPKINEQYKIELIENTSGKNQPVAASTGENQILSLSFIGGIIDRVREWSEKNTLTAPDSSTFPIVMDSPFGSLDENYRRQVASCLPQLANQLVVLATKTQWRGEVEQQMKSYIGKEYVLAYNSPKLNCEEDTIKIGNLSYPLVTHSVNQFEYTEIIEVIAP